MAILAIFWSLKLCLRSICGAKSAWRPFHVRSKVCIQVRSKFAIFAPHIEGSNADFANHMEGSHADFDPHMERRHCFRDQQIAKIAIYVNFLRYVCQTTNILKIYMTYLTTFENKNILRECYSKGPLPQIIVILISGHIGHTSS